MCYYLTLIMRCRYNCDSSATCPIASQLFCNPQHDKPNSRLALAREGDFIASLAINRVRLRAYRYCDDVGRFSFFFYSTAGRYVCRTCEQIEGYTFPTFAHDYDDDDDSGMVRDSSIVRADITPAKPESEKVPKKRVNN